MPLTSKATAKNFFDEMMKWERWSTSLEKDEDKLTELGYERQSRRRLKKLKEIFERYLSKAALERSQSRYDLLSYGEPPEYKIPIIKVEEISDKKHLIYTKSKSWIPDKRFLFIREGDEWRAVYYEYQATGKWIKVRDL